MSNKKSSLLNESTIRRMMKLASVDSLTDSFISTKYSPLHEDAVDEATKKGGKIKTGKTKGEKAYESPSKGEKSKTRKGEEDYTTKKGMKKKTRPGKAYMKEAEEWDINEEEADWGGNKGDESETHPGELDYEDDLAADSVEDEVEIEDEVEEGEVTISDEEAQDIIDLADKLRAALGDEDGEEEAEIETDIGDEGEGVEIADVEVEEEPGMRGGVYEQDLYEAALQGLNINVIDNSRELQKENLRQKVYKRVVKRLLQENKRK